MRVFIKNRILFYFIFFIYTPASFAQDYSFSQFWENRIYYNPSFVGLNEGEFNGQLTYRKLWPKFPGNFSTIYKIEQYRTILLLERVFQQRKKYLLSIRSERFLL